MRLHPTFFDLLFCILIVFVAIATQARPRDAAAEPNLPPVGLPRLDDAPAAGVTGRDRVSVSIVREGESPVLRYFVDSAPVVSAAGVVQRLRETQTARAVLLRADTRVPYGDVLQLLAALSREGFPVALAYEDADDWIGR